LLDPGSSGAGALKEDIFSSSEVLSTPPPVTAVATTEAAAKEEVKTGDTFGGQAQIAMAKMPELPR